VQPRDAGAVGGKATPSRIDAEAAGVEGQADFVGARRGAVRSREWHRHDHGL
jgi:hypothetical protein